MKRVIATAALIALAAGCAGTSQQKEATATANLEPRSGSQVRGTITFTQTGPDIVRVSGEVTGHTKGPKGFH
ncbi:MAG: superoxide dismutase family protein, partial [Burkholderiales bacterium]